MSQALGLPGSWRERTVTTLTGDRRSRAQFAANDPELQPTITIVEIDACTTLEEAVKKTPAPTGVEQLTVIYEQMRDGEHGRFFERVVRYAEPYAGTAVQQSVRVVAYNGRTYALTLSCRAMDFKLEYESFSKAARMFAQIKLAEPPPEQRS